MAASCGSSVNAALSQFTRSRRQHGLEVEEHDVAMNGTPADHNIEPIAAFIAELQRQRNLAGLSRKALSEQLGYDASYVGKIENGSTRPTADFTRRADEFLKADGTLWRYWKTYDQASRLPSKSTTHPPPASTGPTSQAIAGMVVEHDHAELTYADGLYRPVQRKKIYNAGLEPITRYLFRISVDRYPDDPQRSNELYRKHPLTWEELNLFARCNGEEMTWHVKTDRDAFKEIWLLFQNRHARFPLYPDESAWIEYGYTVGDDRWGKWFQRAVRLPTRRLSVELRFPAKLNPTAWGIEMSMTTEARPFRTAIERETREGVAVFHWTTDDPPLQVRYRLEWNFRTSS